MEEGYFGWFGWMEGRKGGRKEEPGSEGYIYKSLGCEGDELIICWPLA